MSWLSKIFGTGPSVIAEGAAGAVVKTAEGVANIVERWKPSDAAKHEMSLEINKLVNDAAAAARSYDPRTVGTSLFSEIVNVTVDATARMIRPVVTVVLLGALVGWWPLVVVGIDPVLQVWTEMVFMFWFGGRAITQDIPKFLAAARKAVAK